MKPWRGAVVIVVTAILLHGSIAFAWTGPTGLPPNGNVAAPINVGSTFQDKAGAAWFDGGVGVNAGSSLCIGTSCITSWAQAGGAVSQWTTSGSNIYYNGGNVGIGTTGPSTKLQLYDGAANDYLTITAPLAFQSSISFGDITNGQDIVTYRPEGTRDYSIWTTTAGSVVRVTQAGNVGIGTTGPLSKLSVGGAGVTYAALYVDATNYARGIISTVTGAGIAITGTSGQGDGVYGLTNGGSGSGVDGEAIGNNDTGGYFTAQGGPAVQGHSDSGLGGAFSSNSGYALITGPGNVGIGLAQPRATLEVNGNSIFDGAATFQSGPYTNDWFRVNGSSGIYWQTYGGGWQMYDSTYVRTYNNTGISAMNNSGRGIQAASENGDWSACFGSDCVGGNATTNGIYANGSTWAGQFGGPVYVSGRVTAAGFFNNSDERLKTNITPLTGNLNAVLRLQPVSYLWKDSSRGAGEQIGFIAQQVQPILPEIVNTDASTTLESLDYSRITTVLVGSVQELNQKIDVQQQKIDAQQQRIDAQQQELGVLQADNDALKAYLCGKDAGAPMCAQYVGPTLRH